jgi:hypothetical protein
VEIWIGCSAGPTAWTVGGLGALIGRHVQSNTRIVFGIVDSLRPSFGYQSLGAPYWEIDDFTLWGT